jgi:hypothetical protein
MRRLICVAAAVGVLAGAAPAFGTDPGTQGQPNQSCQAQTTGPPGLLSTTNGFATKAVNVYAGALNSGSQHSANTQVAVSQYDVACFQLSNPPKP